MDLKKVERVYTSYAGVYDQIFGKVFRSGVPRQSAPGRRGSSQVMRDSEDSWI